MNQTPAPYAFHVYEVSDFSAKLRPALRYKKLWYEERRADLREIQRRTGLSPPGRTVLASRPPGRAC